MCRRAKYKTDKFIISADYITSLFNFIFHSSIFYELSILIENKKWERNTTTIRKITKRSKTWVEREVDESLEWRVIEISRIPRCVWPPAISIPLWKMFDDRYRKFAYVSLPFSHVRCCTRTSHVSLLSTSSQRKTFYVSSFDYIDCVHPQFPRFYEHHYKFFLFFSLSLPLPFLETASISHESLRDEQRAP